MLFNIVPQGNRLMIRPAESNGQAVVIKGIAAILSIAAMLQKEPSSVFIYEVIKVKTKNVCANAAIDLNKDIRLMVSDSV